MSNCLNPTLYPICLSQVRDLNPQDKTDIRPTLVSAGLLLAPEEFQMVLDADNISESTNFPQSLSTLKIENHKTIFYAFSSPQHLAPSHLVSGDIDVNYKVGCYLNIFSWI